MRTVDGVWRHHAHYDVSYFIHQKALIKQITFLSFFFFLVKYWNIVLVCGNICEKKNDGNLIFLLKMLIFPRILSDKIWP